MDDDDLAELAPAEVPLGGVSVRVESLSVSYRTETSNLEGRSRAGRIVGQAAQAIGLSTYTQVHALRDVSFEVREGEHLGVVGANGSGKSTLLRVIAGGESPAEGAVWATATPVLLGVNAVLMPKMTGERNVRLGLLALGFTPDQVEDLMPDVVGLAGIGDAIHRAMSTYSSGMAARLRFAIAASARPNILLVDEALGTGDLAFATRSKRAIDDLCAKAGTIFMVSHAAQTIENMCTRAVWLDRGRLVADGPARAVARTYRFWAHSVALENHKDAEKVFADALAGNLRDG